MTGALIGYRAPNLEPRSASGEARPFGWTREGSGRPELATTMVSTFSTDRLLPDPSQPFSLSSWNVASCPNMALSGTELKVSDGWKEAARRKAREGTSSAERRLSWEGFSKPEYFELKPIGKNGMSVEISLVLRPSGAFTSSFSCRPGHWDSSGPYGQRVLSQH